MPAGHASPYDDVPGAIPLGVEERRQVGMVDAPARGGGDGGLGTERDAEPGYRQHCQIIGAVADRERRRSRDAALRRESVKRVALGVAGHDRRAHGSGDPAVGDVEAIGDNAVKSELGRDPLGKHGEAARDQRRAHPGRARRRDQRSRAGHQADARGCLVEHGFRQAFQQRNPLGQRGSEIEFAIHRPPRDRRDVGAQPDELGQFVEHLILDDCRFEVGDEHPLASASRELNEHIDRGAADRPPGSALGGCGVTVSQREVAGLAWRQPIGGAGQRQFRRQSIHHAGQAPSSARPGDQGYDKAHSAISINAHGRRSEQPADRPSPGNPLEGAPVIIIAGPTASGKSALALGLAAAFGGTIINADSQQIYRDLPILSAQPNAAAMAAAPHRLYGILDAAERGSVGQWRELALAEIAAAHAAGRLPIVVGGTGLYLRALQHGLAAIPEVPAAIRAEAAELYDTLGGPAFRQRLAPFDPIAANRLPAGDRQRLTRAFEVVRATGLPLHEWQAGKETKSPYRFASILLMPPRDALYAACDARFSAMIAQGGLDEAAALAARGLAADLPAMKGVGIPELLGHLRGALTLDAAILLAQRATRRYAKRQTTWFRHQMIADLLLAEQFSESLLRCSRHFIDHFLLTRRT